MLSDVCPPPLPPFNCGLLLWVVYRGRVQHLGPTQKGLTSWPCKIVRCLIRASAFWSAVTLSCTLPTAPPCPPAERGEIHRPCLFNPTGLWCHGALLCVCVCVCREFDVRDQKQERRQVWAGEELSPDSACCVGSAGSQDQHQDGKNSKIQIQH